MSSVFRRQTENVPSRPHNSPVYTDRITYWPNNRMITFWFSHANPHPLHRRFITVSNTSFIRNPKRWVIWNNSLHFVPHHSSLPERVRSRRCGWGSGWGKLPSFPNLRKLITLHYQHSLIYAGTTRIHYLEIELAWAGSNRAGSFRLSDLGDGFSIGFQ